MRIEPFINDEQDPKNAEKVLGKISDMLTPGEQVIYLAVQKKPAVTLIPDSIVVTDKRLIFCKPGNLGLTTNFEIYSWKDIKDVSFKEEFFGAKFTAVPSSGENFTIDYIPKVQARKLFQFCNQQLERNRELERTQALEKEKALRPQNEIATRPSIEENFQKSFEQANIPVAPSVPVPEIAKSLEDEITQKLQKLRTLYEKQLITQEEYEAKKADILSQL
ncbi:PH domain-containing protein [Pedobacter sp. P351]|uniref:PH domain-containing protein n=1 Tax=Pedobacter superstes TaxID=3133441 RepID=UPI00309A380A